MAKTLLESIQQDLGTPQAEMPQRGQTEQVGGLLRAKLGKATELGAAPRASDIQEQQAIQQARLGAQQVAQRGQLLGAQQAEREADIGQRAAQQQEQAAQQLKSMEQARALETDRLLNELATAEKRLDNKEFMTKLEQAGFNLRHQNQDYINRLRAEGRRQRFDDSQSFRQAVAKDAFKNNLAILNDEAMMQNITMMDDLAWNKKLADMDINDAIAMADSAAEAAAAKQIFSGIGGITTAGVSAWEASEAKKAKQAQALKEESDRQELLAAIKGG